MKARIVVSLVLMGLLSVGSAYSMTNTQAKQLEIAAANGNNKDWGKLNAAAESGDAVAQKWLSAYQAGKDLTAETLGYKSTAYGDKKAAEQGYAGTQAHLVGKAQYWYEMATKQGSTTDLSKLKSEAQSGDVAAENWFGNYSYVKSHYWRAFHWWEKAAEQGNASAEYNLGVAYYHGYGVQDDMKKAVYWWKKAAEQGNAKAEYNMGYLYRYGRDVPQNLAKSNYWYEKAAEQGSAKAQEYEKAIEQKKARAQQKDQEKSRAQGYEKAAEHGNASAENKLGDIYLYGKGMSRNFVKANYWYEKAAEQGDASAEYHLGNAYFYGHGVPQDNAKANYWYKKAAEQGNARAETDLGSDYYHGRGVPKDYVKANYWYKKAAEQGNARAETDLGSDYYHGRGVSQDTMTAMKWWKKAAAQGHKKIYSPGTAAWFDIAEAEGG